MFHVLRFKKTERREFECEVVTPLFLGGACPKKAEQRAASVKAGMRFWWRAQYPGTDLIAMARREAEIFGSIDKKSSVSVQLADMAKPVLNNLPLGTMVSVQGKPFPTSIINYLSYGLFEYKKDLKKNIYIKEHIESGTKFKMIVSFPNSFEVDVIKALSSMISFGGLGARTRNGFGSVHCDDLVDHTFKAEGPLKSFTAFSHGSVLFSQFKTHGTWQDALSEIGVRYRDARLSLEPRHEFVKRSFIAMPIEAQRENIPHLIRSGRHAKPYFLHVSKTPQGKYQGHILFLPYLFKSGPNDTSNKFREYEDACRKMNEEITKGMGGTR